MKNKNNKKIIAAFLSAIIFLMSFSFPVCAADNAENEDLTNDIESLINYFVSKSGYDNVQEWLSSGEISEWCAFSLSRYDVSLDFSEYHDKFMRNFLITSVAYSAVEYQRMALPMLFSGYRDDADLIADLDSNIGRGGIMSLIFGLHLLTNGLTSEDFTSDSLIESLLEKQLSDGGWEISGSFSNVDVTAMTVQALAPYTNDEKVSASVEKAMKFLSNSQLENGGFINYGVENAESIAQVIVALTSLGRDPENDADFAPLVSALNNFKVADGGYSHTVNGDVNNLASTQALYALISVFRLREGKSALYVYTDSENIPDTGSTPDSDTISDSDITPDSDPTPDSDTTPVSDPDNIIDNEKSDNIAKKSSYKLYAAVVIIILTVIITSVLFLRGKRNFKNYIPPIIFAAAALAVVFFVDFSLPEDYYGSTDQKENIIGEVTVSIEASCAEDLDEKGIIPEGGIILKEVTLPLAEGETVYDITIEVCRLYSIGIESAAGSSYIRGIAFIYEFDFGELSGWTYAVNGISPSVGCGDYTLSDGDRIEWIYVLEPIKIGA